MITNAQYFGVKPHSQSQEEAATNLLTRVNMLVSEAVRAGAFERAIDPDTGTQISGSRGGAGDGGFRLPSATTVTAGSSHKQAMGVADGCSRYSPAWASRVLSPSPCSAVSSQSSSRFWGS